jgi:hypothetical protein
MTGLVAQVAQLESIALQHGMACHGLTLDPERC